jgi:hypothetical protein
MCEGRFGYKGAVPSSRCIVAAPLPGDILFDAVMNDAANKEVDKKRDTKDRDCHVKRRKVRPGNP